MAVEKEFTKGGIVPANSEDICWQPIVFNHCCCATEEQEKILADYLEENKYKWQLQAE